MAAARGGAHLRLRRGGRTLGRHSGDLAAREGRGGRHRALRGRGLAAPPRCRVRAVPHIRQRAVALRAEPVGGRGRVSGDVPRPHRGSADAGVSRVAAHGRSRGGDLRVGVG
ncbi:hypothetical protein MICRO8M_60075 [Microbacterium sp. 8M]|nr:hypothetical protein MICRO8M_60075 [Microbacterium sp. 8M]